MSGRITVFYDHAVIDAPGVGGVPNTYISVFNPASSNVAMAALLLDYQAYSVGVADVPASLKVWRISAASGGTLLSPETVNRFDTLHPDPLCEVRTGNPAITMVGHALRGFAPVVSDKRGDMASNMTGPPNGTSFTCRPGQGLAFRTDLGDIDIRWNITFVWAELR